MNDKYHHPEDITFPTREEGMDLPYFTGRNGTYQSSAIQLAGYDNSGIVTIQPITAKKKIVANCGIDVPYEVVPTMILQLAGIISESENPLLELMVIIRENAIKEIEWLLLTTENGITSDYLDICEQPDNGFYEHVTGIDKNGIFLVDNHQDEIGGLSMQGAYEEGHLCTEDLLTILNDIKKFKNQ